MSDVKVRIDKNNKSKYAGKIISMDKETARLAVEVEKYATYVEKENKETVSTKELKTPKTTK